VFDKNRERTVFPTGRAAFGLNRRTRGSKEMDGMTKSITAAILAVLTMSVFGASQKNDVHENRKENR
jgi:hypothetical protein